jgi:DNA polymerase I
VSKPRELPNIPRDDKTVKRAILPKRGSFSFFDYKAIEPRLVAYYTYKLGHPAFAEQIIAGVDPYTAVARLVTGKKEITDDERNVWKRIFLAILYGAGPKRVREVWLEEAKEDISLAEAKRIYKKFHAGWPAVRALQDSVVSTHGARGFIRSITGRHLHMEEFGDYKLANKLIQGSAADVMKKALLRVDKWLRAHPEIESRMVSVVHDEIIFDGPESEIPILHEAIPPLMVDATVNEIVPIAVDHEVSTTSWAEKISYEEWVEQRIDVADPNSDLIGFSFNSTYRGRDDFRTTVTGVAPWNPAYLLVDVVKSGKTEQSSRRAEHVRSIHRRETVADTARTAA